MKYTGRKIICNHYNFRIICNTRIIIFLEIRFNLVCFKLCRDLCDYWMPVNEILKYAAHNSKNISSLTHVLALPVSSKIKSNFRVSLSFRILTIKLPHVLFIVY